MQLIPEISRVIPGRAALFNGLVGEVVSLLDRSPVPFYSGNVLGPGLVVFLLQRRQLGSTPCKPRLDGWLLGGRRCAGMDNFDGRVPSG